MMTETLHVCGFKLVLIMLPGMAPQTNFTCTAGEKYWHVLLLSSPLPDVALVRQHLVDPLQDSSSLPDLQQLSPDYQEGSWLALAVFSRYP